MPRTFELNLDLSKIDKDKVYKGKKGTYYKLIVRLNDEVGMYDQIGWCKTATTKEERDAGYETPFLGNLVELSFEKKEAEPTPVEDAEDDLPF